MMLAVGIDQIVIEADFIFLKIWNGSIVNLKNKRSDVNIITF
jgi:hypothetical protein